MEEWRIDLIQEFVNLYVNEDTLAFFDFRLRRPGADPVSGLCRIAKSNNGDPKIRYLSLTYFVDAPDEACGVAVDDMLAAMQGDALKHWLPEIVALLPVPNIAGTSECYVRQMDIMVEAGANPDRAFVCGRLLPAIRNFTKVVTGEVVWWNEGPGNGEGPSQQPDAVPNESASRVGSLLARLTRFMSPRAA